MKSFVSLSGEEDAEETAKVRLSAYGVYRHRYIIRSDRHNLYAYLQHILF